MIDAVLTYHTNPHTCGVAKFNYRLALELGVPCAPIKAGFAAPLLSIKGAEMPDGWERQWQFFGASTFDLFIHDCETAVSPLLLEARRVFAANSKIAEAIRTHRPDVIEVFCPATLQGNSTRANLNVLVFGMANKLNAAPYERLRALLDDHKREYTVSVSTAVHEGTPWDEVPAAGERMRAIFGDKTRILGYLADDALVRELDHASAVAIVFEPAVRANNTTLWAALERGKAVITTLDEHSPRELAHNWNVYDIAKLEAWPCDVSLHHVGRMGQEVALRYNWDALLKALC